MTRKLYRGIMADLDGTVNRGDLLLPGARAVYEDLTRAGIRWVFLSNNATLMASDIAEKVKNLGIPVSGDQVVNSAVCLIDGLTGRFPSARVLVVGEPRLFQGLRDARVTLEDDPDKADVVVVAMDRDFNYDKLRRAQRAILRGALFWATNLDASLPVEDGFLPGAGSIVAAVSTAAGRPPDKVFGKPSPDMASLALDRMGLRPESCVVVGDRMETDILFARNAKIDSALVLTGATSREDLSDFTYAPDHVLESISELPTLFR